MKLLYGIFYTNDLARATKFYKEKIGLEVAFGDDRFIAFKIGDSLLGIKIKEIKREVPGHQTIIISTKDVSSLYSSLKKESVTIFSELINSDWGRNFSILDPDMNRVEFVESTK